VIRHCQCQQTRKRTVIYPHIGVCLCRTVTSLRPSAFCLVLSETTKAQGTGSNNHQEIARRTTCHHNDYCESTATELHYIIQHVVFHVSRETERRCANANAQTARARQLASRHASMYVVCRLKKIYMHPPDCSSNAWSLDSIVTHRRDRPIFQSHVRRSRIKKLSGALANKK